MLRIEDHYLDGIPVTIYEKDDGKEKPILYFFHGFTSNRHDGMMGRGEDLANMGFFVVVLDAYLHGERQPEYFKHWTNAEKQREINNIVIQTAKDAKRLYHKYFKHYPQVKTDGIYAYGISMGAAICFYLATIMEEVKTIVTLVGSPSLYAFYLEKKARFGWEENDYLKRNLDEYKERCPLLHPERFRDINIFMGTGLQDQVVPRIYAEELYHKLNRDNVVYKTYDVGHNATGQMQEDAYAFIRAY